MILFAAVILVLILAGITQLLIKANRLVKKIILLLVALTVIIVLYNNSENWLYVDFALLWITLIIHSVAIFMLPAYKSDEVTPTMELQIEKFKRSYIAIALCQLYFIYSVINDILFWVNAMSNNISKEEDNFFLISFLTGYISGPARTLYLIYAISVLRTLIKEKVYVKLSWIFKIVVFILILVIIPAIVLIFI